LRARHALFVAYHYPPEAGSSGVLRTLKYTSYLHQYGWRVSVLTLDPTAYTIRDAQLEAQIPADVRVVRTRYLNSKRHLAVRGVYPALLAVPDIWIGWYPWAIAAGRQLLHNDAADVIYSTSPHATAHIIAMRLARMQSLPWVTDFRDPWIEYPPEPGAPNGRVFLAVNRHLEARVVARCSHVVTSTMHLCDTLRTRYPTIPTEKFSAIPNGYDEADFADLPMQSESTSEKLVIVHAGNINAEFRDPRPLFRALRVAADRGLVDLSDVRLRFIGGGPFTESEELRDALAATNLTPHVEMVGRMPYNDALRELGRADLLLLLQASDDTVGLVPAKLYEYLRAQKPVLALVFPGSTAEVLSTTDGGWAVDPRQPEALVDVIANIYQVWRSKTLAAHRASLERLRRYERSALTGELAAVFDHVVQLPR
jgi:glycosyltransferase involved in cell wall biosynthesis